MAAPEIREPLPGDEKLDAETLVQNLFALVMTGVVGVILMMVVMGDW